TRSASSTASAGDAATLAPRDSRARAFDAVRFHTVTVSPWRSMPSTIALPSSPVPINATFAIARLRIESTAVLRRFIGPANHLRQGYGGPPKRFAKAEAGPYVLFFAA